MFEQRRFDSAWLQKHIIKYLLQECAIQLTRSCEQHLFKSPQASVLIGSLKINQPIP